MAISLRESYVSRPSVAPVSSTSDGSYFVAHRRINQTGQRSSLSPITSEVTLPATITPQSYSDTDALLRDEILVSTDQTTWYIVPSDSDHTGALSVPAFNAGWAVTTVTGNQINTALNLNFGTFSSVSEPSQYLYVVNGPTSVDNLQVDFINDDTGNVLTELAGHIEVSLEGVYPIVGNNPDTSFNSTFLWDIPQKSINTFQLQLPALYYAKIKVTLIDIPLGGLENITYNFNIQISTNRNKFPISWEQNWLNGSFLIDDTTVFKLPIIEGNGNANEVVVNPFRVNQNGILNTLYFSKTLTGVTDGTGKQVVYTSSGQLKIESSSYTLASGEVLVGTFDISGSTVSNVEYPWPIRTFDFDKIGSSSSIDRGRFVSLSGTSLIENTNGSNLIGVTLEDSTNLVAVSGKCWLQVGEAVSAGDYLEPGTSGKGFVAASEGVCVALADGGTDDLVEVRLLPLGSVSGGGGSSSPLTTKGDLWIYSTLDTRLPVGTNGQILSADSTETTGLKWIDNTGGSGSSTFIGLTDTPNSYSGSAFDLVRVNTGNDGLEYWTPDYISGVAWGDITGTLADQTDLQSVLNNKLESSDVSDFETSTELDARDTDNRDRANHTGTQSVSTITGLATVATSGDYDDLTNKPDLFSGSYNDLTDQPSLFDGDYNSLTNLPTLGDLAALDTVSDTKITGVNWSKVSSTPTTLTGYGITDAYTETEVDNLIIDFETTTQLNSRDTANRSRSNHTGTQAASTITGLATVATSGSYDDLTDKPTLFSGSYDDLTDKPTLFDGDYDSLINLPTLGDLAALDTITDTEVTDISWSKLTSVPTNVSTIEGWTSSQVSRAGNLPSDTSGLIIKSAANTFDVKTDSEVFEDGSPLTTKGDLLVYATAETRLPVGSNGNVLTADSSESSGLAWKNMRLISEGVTFVNSFQAYGQGVGSPNPNGIAYNRDLGLAVLTFFIERSSIPTFGTTIMTWNSNVTPALSGSYAWIGTAITKPNNDPIDVRLYVLNNSLGWHLLSARGSSITGLEYANGSLVFEIN
jgi:hypothetical protein